MPLSLYASVSVAKPIEHPVHNERKDQKRLMIQSFVIAMKNIFESSFPRSMPFGPCAAEVRVNLGGTKPARRYQPGA